MQASENDSMWLQKSIALPDPLPEASNAVPPAESTTGQDATPPTVSTPENVVPSTEMAMPRLPLSSQGERKPLEMELTRLAGDMSSLVGHTQRPSLRYSTRMSVAGSAFITVQEYDDLRNRYSQTKRELMRVSDIQRDLDFAKFELARSADELQLVKESNRKLKRSLEEALQRVEQERQARLDTESREEEERAARGKELDFLRRQMAELREENSKRLEEMTGQQETEYQNRMQGILEELHAVSDAREELGRQLLEAHNAREFAERQLKEACAERAKAQEVATEKETKLITLRAQCMEAEEQRQLVLHQAQEERSTALAAQQAVYEERIQQVLAARDKLLKQLEAELRETQTKNRQLADELSTTRHKAEQTDEEMQQIKAMHTKELQWLRENHELALSEVQMRLEAAAREATSGRSQREEEIQSLRRQLAKLTEELRSTTTALAQREQELSQSEQETRDAKDNVCHAEQTIAQLKGDLALQSRAVEEANERVRRLNLEKDVAEEEFARDYTESKAKLRNLEDSLMACRTELSTLRKEQIESGDEARTTIQTLRAALESLRGEKLALQRQLSDQQHGQTTAEEYRHKYAAEKQRADNLNVELCAAIGRCSTLERRLAEEQQRRRQNVCVGQSPVATSQSGLGGRALQLRSMSSTNALSQPGSTKRARTEDARVFAISGFEGGELLLAIRQLPNVAIAECKSNMPVPSNLTHLVTNGQLTIKLLSALVHGCWILPASYVTDSLKRHMWLNETEYGFQHEEPPLLKKRVAFTEGFMSCKHFSTASLLVKEGGAVVVDGAAEADMVLCTNAELTTQDKGISWEAMVDLVYPVRIE